MAAFESPSKKPRDTSVDFEGASPPGLINGCCSTSFGPNFQARISESVSVRTDMNAGSRGPSGRENQDSFFSGETTLDGAKILVTIVADGHGLYGRFFSAGVVEGLPEVIMPQIKDIIQNPQDLGPIFIDFNDTLTAKLGQMFPDGLLGGTTVTLVIEGDGFKICANLADCEAICKIETDPSNIRMTRDGIDVSVESNDIELTVSHGPHLSSEVERLLGMGASIKFASQDPFAVCKDAYTVKIEDGVTTYEAVPITSQPGAYYNDVNGTTALYVHMDRFTLNLTASMGNVGCPFMKRSPTITVVTFPKGTAAKSIVASDGYFNCFKPAEISEQLTLTPEMICSNAYTKVGSTFGHAHADNMTVIVTTMP